MRRIESGRSRLIRTRIHFSSFTCLLVLAVLAVPSQAADNTPARFRGELSLYPYLDRVDEDTDLTLTVNARLSNRLAYFSYQNFRGVVSSGDARFIRSEQNLRWAISKSLPLDLNVQAVMVKGDGNDQWHLGIGWRLHDTGFLKEIFERLNLRYRVTFQMKRFASSDEDGMLIEHFFKARFPRDTERFYLSGFLDQNFNNELPAAISNNPIVTEIQFGARMFDSVFAVAEYRINQFRSSEIHNFALGIEYSFRW
jgi:hypothetical protein